MSHSPLSVSHPPVVDENTAYTGDELETAAASSTNNNNTAGSLTNSNNSNTAGGLTVNNNTNTGGTNSRKFSEESFSAVPRSRKETAYSEDLSNYYVPMREQSQNERLDQYKKYLFLPVSQMQEIMREFQEELKKGLDAHRNHPESWVEEECSFKMIDSCIDVLPTGDELGVFYAVDFGGTNLRAVRAELHGDGRIERTQVKYSLKYEGPSARDKGLLDARSTASELFNHFASRVKKVMEMSGDMEKHHIDQNPVPVGFTFSFPCLQTEIDSSVLLEWTKGFETGRETDDPVEHKDVGKLLDEAFKRADTPAKLVAILNDTVGTLLSCSYQKGKSVPDCLIGLILGTGANGCYVEERGAEFGYKGKIINIEMGNFNKKLPFTEVDLEIDWHTSNKGHQLFEKQISGAYLGEIVRRFVLRVFQFRAPMRAWIDEAITAEDVARILNDHSSDLRLCRECINEKWSMSMDLDDLKDVQSICVAVFDRSARLASIAICAIALQTGRLKDGGRVTCGVDGSLYVKNPWYAERVRSHMADLLGEEMASRIHVMPADDGSGKGAAILAAVIAKQKRLI